MRNLIDYVMYTIIAIVVVYFVYRSVRNKNEARLEFGFKAKFALFGLGILWILLYLFVK